MPTHESTASTEYASNHHARTLITSLDGAVNGFSLGVSYYTQDTYGEPGVHDDQEGFYVLEGSGMARVGDEEFPISPGAAFIAPKGVPHTIRKDPHVTYVKVLWSHGAV
jgi:mannose-6-phosphate isomerase-like protein (cupin superfamily)